MPGQRGVPELDETVGADLATPVGVEVRDLEASYGTTTVLRGIDIDVAPGEIVALLGPSGCGKTTLLRAIAGLEAPTAGTVTIGGVLVNGSRPVPPQRRRVGMVFQDGALFPHLNVADNVGYGLPRRSRRGPTARDLLAMVGLADKAERYPGMLSGGEQQRVALARALAPNPAVILLDEPFSSLDATLRVQLRTEVRQLLKDIGVTSILVTHDQQEALMFGDRVAVMRDGAIEQLDTPIGVYDRPTTTWVARFVGEANILRGTAAGGHVHTGVGILPTAAGVEGDTLVLCRPERLELGDGDDGVVLSCTYVGQETQYVVRLTSGETVTALGYGSPAFAPDGRVAVTYHGDAAAHTWSGPEA
jgi:iron(III) transport system ATP-binding protein